MNCIPYHKWQPNPNIREFMQPRRRRQQERHKFAYLTMKNNRFACFACAVFILVHFADVLVLFTTWNDPFSRCVDDVSIWWQMFNFIFLPLKRWLQFNSRIVKTHFASIVTLNNSEMIAETWSYIFRWRSRCHRRHVCINSLLKLGQSVRGHFVRLIEVGMCLIIACNPGHIWGVSWPGHKNFASESYDFWDLTPFLNCTLRQEFWVHIISPHPGDILPSISLLWTSIPSGFSSYHKIWVMKFFISPLETRLHFFTGLVIKLCMSFIVFKLSLFGQESKERWRNYKPVRCGLSFVLK